MNRNDSHATDSPLPGQRVYDQCIFIAGNFAWPEGSSSSPLVRAWIDGVCIGETRIFTEIESPERRPGYKILGKLPEPITTPREAVIVIRLYIDGDNAGEKLGELTVQLVPALLHERPYGEVVYPENETLLRRENIYGSGPPIEEPGIEVANLLREYLPDRSSVVDVGCGAGAYGPGLMAAGHDWLGLEANSHCCDILRRRQLPFRRVDPESRALPCADREFDCAICVEVLEHVNDPEAFLREIARVVRKRALFSVPNMEVLPYLHDWRVVPWHLLEGDHKNFFTRASLRTLLQRYFRHVEIFSYGEHPLRTRDGIALHVHLWAIAGV